MKKLSLRNLVPVLLAGSLFVATPASAVVVFLSGAPTSTSGGWQFSYQANFSDGEGVKNGSTFVIFDFAGYVPGSVFSPYADLVASSELLSAGLPTSPDFTDDPTISNLRFTYTGTSLLNLSNASFSGLNAVSVLSGIAQDGFGAVTVKSSGPLLGSKVYSAGLVSVPSGIPEPAAWGMMLAGFGLTGAAMRRRRFALTSVTA
ncbi:MAG: hypothetical protein RLZZ561_1602 [Pseudomonadota bacterium]|jgi:hypothetical protein